MLSTSVRAVWRLRSAGKLPNPLSIGGSVRCIESEISALIRAGAPDRKKWNSVKGGNRYLKSGTRKRRDSFKAASFDIVGVRKFTIDECRTAGYFGGLKLEIKDKDGDIIDWIRLTDEQGAPLINVLNYS